MTIRTSGHGMFKIKLPESYTQIWNSSGPDTVDKIQALLKDYTKESSFLGSFLGRVFTGHWNRHHVDRVHVIANSFYSDREDLLHDLKLINCVKNGSLSRRIQFIEREIEAQEQELLAAPV